MVSGGQLGTLPVLTVLLALTACGLVLIARQVFPRRLSEDDHQRLEAELASA
jgi:hypothetical protein